MSVLANKWIDKEPKKKAPSKEKAKSSEKRHMPVYMATRSRTLSGVRK